MHGGRKEGEGSCREKSGGRERDKKKGAVEGQKHEKDNREKWEVERQVDGKGERWKKVRKGKRGIG